MVEYYPIEDRINELMKDGQILNKRLAAANQLRGFLENRGLQAILKEYEIKETEWQSFCQAEEPHYTQVKTRIFETLGRRDIRYFSMLEAVESKIHTAQKLSEKVWDKRVRTEVTSFAKESGTTYNTIMRFFTGSWYTSQKALDSFADGMHLTGKERQSFLDSAPKGAFLVTPILLDKVNRELEAQGIGLIQFLDANYMTDGAWAPYRKEKEEKDASAESRNRITTQDTLLKLAIGFKMTPDESKAFLQLVNSDFIMRLDVVILACIYCKIYEPEQLYYILEAFSLDKSANGYGKARFSNLYAGYALLADKT